MERSDWRRVRFIWRRRSHVHDGRSVSHAGSDRSWDPSIPDLRDSHRLDETWSPSWLVVPVSVRSRSWADPWLAGRPRRQRPLGGLLHALSIIVNVVQIHFPSIVDREGLPRPSVAHVSVAGAISCPAITWLAHPGRTDADISWWMTFVSRSAQLWKFANTASRIFKFAGRKWTQTAPPRTHVLSDLSNLTSVMQPAVPVDSDKYTNPLTDDLVTIPHSTFSQITIPRKKLVPRTLLATKINDRVLLATETRLVLSKFMTNKSSILNTGRLKAAYVLIKELGLHEVIAAQMTATNTDLINAVPRTGNSGGVLLSDVKAL